MKIIIATGLVIMTLNASADYMNKRSVACMSKDLLDQMYSMLAKNDKKGAEYLLKKGCVVTNENYDISILDRGLIKSKIRAYVEDNAIELWTASENITRD